MELSEIEPQFHELKARDPKQILLFRDGGFYTAIHEDASFLVRHIITSPFLHWTPGSMAHFEERYLEDVLSLIVERHRRAAVLERVERAPKGAKPERIAMKGE